MLKQIEFLEKYTGSKKNNKTPQYLDGRVLVDSENRGTILLPFYSPDPEVPTILKDDYLKSVAERARRNKFIGLQELVYIMAADEQYIQSLPKLWFKYQCDSRGPKDPKVPKVTNTGERLGLWFDLLERWGHGRVRGVPRKNDGSDVSLEDIIYLRLYRYNKVKGELELYDRSLEYSDHSDPKVKLEDLKEYLNEIIKIPLPELLYPKPPSQSEQEPKNKAQEYPEEVTFKKKSHNVFPCEPGTPWNKVIITRISYDAAMIETPKGSGRFHFSELKMSDKRSGDIPTNLWKLLMYFCEYTGRITSQTSTHGIQNLSKTRSDLNKRLKDIFGIHENFCKKYNSNDGWVANCQFRDKIESA